jgi:hypothetical protein
VAGRLRRLPGAYCGRHPYKASGSLDGLVPGRREIGKLIVGRFADHAVEGLRPLAAFGDLRELDLEWPVGVDLEPLAGLPLERLRIEDGKGLDLEPIARITSLQWLHVFSPDRCLLPSEWDLSPSLTSLSLFAADGSPQFLGDAVAAIPWRRLTSLTGLGLGAEAAWLDLGFLSDLPQLRGLDLRGVRHRGVGPSPLEPPFAGLPRGLDAGLIEVPSRDAVLDAFRAHVGLPAKQSDGGLLNLRDLRWPADLDSGPWAISAPLDDDDSWTAYGSLYRGAEGQHGETEYDALRVARRRLREADPALLRRLDFDQEADGTGIYGRSRADLETALRILGLLDPD